MEIGELTQLAPAVHFASRHQVERGTEFGPRMIPDCQWIYVVSGEAALQLGSEKIRLMPGECAFYGPAEPHKLVTVHETEFFSLHFSWRSASPEPIHPAYRIEGVSESALTGTPAECTIVLPGGKPLVIPRHFFISGMEPLLMRIVKEYQQTQLGHGVAMRAYMLELILHVIRGISERAAHQTNSKIEPALQAMRDRPYFGWSVGELAEKCGYHPSYFTKLFYEEVGVNPKQYLIAERIKWAKQALLIGEPMESIASRLGYSSVHYFSHNFKKETGLTPSEFRQDLKAGAF